MYPKLLNECYISPKRLNFYKEENQIKYSRPSAAAKSALRSLKADLPLSCLKLGDPL